MAPTTSAGTMMRGQRTRLDTWTSQPTPPAGAHAPQLLGPTLRSYSGRRSAATRAARSTVAFHRVVAHEDSGELVDGVPERDREAGGEDLRDRVLRHVCGAGPARH